jgi:hypothetical protein
MTLFHTTKPIYTLKNDNLLINNNTSLDITHDLFQLKDAQTFNIMHTAYKRKDPLFISSRLALQNQQTHDTCKNNKLVSQNEPAYEKVVNSCNEFSIVILL